MLNTRLCVDSLGSHKKRKLTHIRRRNHVSHPIRERNTGVVMVSPALTIGEGGKVDRSVRRLVIQHGRHQVFGSEHKLIIGIDTLGVHEVEGHGS